MADLDTRNGRSGSNAEHPGLRPHLPAPPALDVLLDQAPTVVYVKDLEGRFLYANRILEETFGIPRAELIGRTVYDFWGDEADDLSQHDRQVIDSRRALLFDEPVTQDDGLHMYLSFKFPLLDDVGEVCGLGGISTDVTDRYLAVQQLEAAKKAAERSSEAKLDFIARMSHELRTPLTAINGFAQLLMLDELTESQREAAEVILRAGNHLASLIDDILDVSRIESGRLSMSVESVAVSEVGARALELVRPMAEQRGIEIRVRSSATWAEFVEADRQRLLQVLLNLLTNAVKYNKPSGEVELACRPGSRPSTLAIDVSDTGPGIEPDKLERVFAPFDRLGRDDSEIEGTGIGLSLSKALVEQMHGSLSVTSTVGVGTTFTIELKRAASLMAGAATAPAGTAASPPVRILYIEDNVANFKLLDPLLRQRPNSTLIPAIHGALGIDLAYEHQPDLILLDLHLPDMPGVEVLRALRANRATRDIPIVVLTADATAGLPEQLVEAGARLVLTKPLDLGALLTVIDDVTTR